MERYRKILFIVVVLLQLALLSYMILKRTHLLKTGTKILLQCEPVDPRSLFSGDYVILNYKISNLDLNLSKSFEDQDNIKNNDTVYVGLQKEENGKFWIARNISKDKNKLKTRYQVVIRGRVIDTYNEYSIKYGVEEYFVPQFEGKDIEQNMASTSVEVSVSESGESAINKLFIDDKEVKFY